MNALERRSPASGVGRARAIEDEIHRAITEAEEFDLVTMGRGEGPRCYCYVNNLLRKSLDTLSKNYDAVIVFVRTKTATLELAEKLEARGHSCEALNGDVPQKQRERIVEVARLSGLVLDPACGSGNFLYVAVNLLLDLEKEVIAYAAGRGMGLLPQVRPTQLHGIEINPYAHELAQATIWIGYIQWLRENGFGDPPEPILKPLHNILQIFLPREDKKGPAASFSQVVDAVDNNLYGRLAGSLGKSPENALDILRLQN